MHNIKGLWVSFCFCPFEALIFLPSFFPYAFFITILLYWGYIVTFIKVLMSVEFTLPIILIYPPPFFPSQWKTFR
jgi:hypothetical protein